MLARHRIEPLSIPGVVLSGYPERTLAPAAEPEGLLHRAFALLPAPERTGRHDAFARKVALQREQFEPLSDESFRCIVDYLRKQLFDEGCEHGPQAQALACAGEAARRVLGWLPFPTQIIAARMLLQNRLAQMQTGEGKTFAIALAAGVAAMAGIPVHCITANEYLVVRDAEMFKAFYARLGLRVGTVLHAHSPDARRQAYACDITYCTAGELAIDYLKDGLLHRHVRHDLQHRVGGLISLGAQGPQPVLRGLCMAIVDEADSVLIDEASTPLILTRSLQTTGEVAELQQALRIARNLRSLRHFVVVGDRIDLTPQALTVLGKLGTSGTSPWPDARRCEAQVTLALRALNCYHPNHDYVVHAGKVHFINQSAGRLAEDRDNSRSLRQLIELKEGCVPTGRQAPLAQITLPRFFRRYLRLAGTSGTLMEVRRELRAAYRLRVSEVPLRAPSKRQQLGLRVFHDENTKWQHVLNRVGEMRAARRPVLIGTDSIAASERLSQRLAQAGMEHRVLNARQDQAEADAVARAGEAGHVTVATDMAGRGTDIALGPGVAERGGLHVISCQLSGEARIDRQLHGRAARLGDPGSVETLLSLDDTLIAKRLSRPLRRVLRRSAGAGGRLPHWLASAVMRMAQKLEGIALRAARSDLVRAQGFNARRFSLSSHTE